MRHALHRNIRVQSWGWREKPHCFVDVKGGRGFSQMSSHCLSAARLEVGIFVAKTTQAQKDENLPHGHSRLGMWTSLVSTSAGSQLHEGEVSTEAESLHRAQKAKGRALGRITLRGWEEEAMKKASPRAAITNDHKLSGFKQQKHIVLQLWRMEIQNQAVHSIRSFWRLQQRIISMSLSQLLVVAKNPWRFLTFSYKTPVSTFIFTWPFCSVFHVFSFIRILIFGFKAHFDAE